MKNLRQSALFFALLAAAFVCAGAQVRSSELINSSWKFSLGDASSKEADFTHGTEYFTYFTKVRSNNGNLGPASPDFDDSSWETVTLPHDWVVDLPFSGEASHSHGYKCVGWKYPQNSVGWYRKRLDIPESWRGSRFIIEFGAIFRDSQVFFNGIYLGGEPSGYTSQLYDVTDYIRFGQENIVTVRADASLEEGWFYEGAGIWCDVTLHRMNTVAVIPHSTQIDVTKVGLTPGSRSRVTCNTEIFNQKNASGEFTFEASIRDAQGSVMSSATVTEPMAAWKHSVSFDLEMKDAHLWNLDDPYLYTLQIDITKDGQPVDRYTEPFGFRKTEFTQAGFFLNGKPVKLTGGDLHLDHAGVGVAVPEAVWRYRLETLKSFGFNFIRSSHNPAPPAMLSLCDRIGMLVIDENRWMGSCDEQLRTLESMVSRDRNHPSVLLWSIGNEEWAVEYDPTGEAIADRMVSFVHSIDPYHPVTYGNCGGNFIHRSVDVMGFNYIVQNAIDAHHAECPDKCAVGTEETSGSGTRGKYSTDPAKGWMMPINIRPDSTGLENVIERGWKYYAERPWAAGVCYWTGQDYRGESNPLVWPATGSQFGIFDYCCFPKEDAYYLKSWWTDEPVLYIYPHWNRDGRDGSPDMTGKTVDIWCYSNCDEVQLTVNGRNLGRRKMPHDGHLRWQATYKPGKAVATGYVKGRKVMTTVIETTLEASAIKAVSSATALKADGRDVAVIDLTLLDSKGREVPTADNEITVSLDNLELVGWGNGDPGFKHQERGCSSVFAFSGKAQLLVRPVDGAGGTGRVTLGGEGLTTQDITFDIY